MEITKGKSLSGQEGGITMEIKVLGKEIKEYESGAADTAQKACAV